MNRRIVYLSSVGDELRRLARQDRIEAVDRIEALAEEPRPEDAVQLSGYQDVWRIRFGRGKYRVVYRIRPERIIVERVRERNDVYKGLAR